MEHCDILIIGAGAAGLAAAEAAWNAGCNNILLVDRKSSPGGILLQCLHRGFGAGLDGPEYIEKLTANFPPEIRCLPDTTVVSVSDSKLALLKSPRFGEKAVSFDQLILATGCLEIPMGFLPIAGTRPRGVYTAGQMQEMMNLHGFRPEGPVVILGSGGAENVCDLLHPRNLKTYIKALSSDEHLRRVLSTEFTGLIDAARRTKAKFDENREAQLLLEEGQEEP